MALTPEQAREHLLAGDVLAMTVGPNHVMRVWEDDGMIYHVCVEGWSAGVVESVCERDSDYLRVYLASHAFEVKPANWKAAWA